MFNGLPLALALTTALACTAWSAEQRSPKEPDFFPLGVYWPGEFVPRGSEGVDWRRVETLLDGLAKQNCNTIWLTHMSASEQASFSRLAAKRSIFLVASLSELDGGTEGNPAPRTTDHAAQMAAVLGAWGDAPRPIAWGLGDEPRSSFMHELQPYAKAWSDAGQPVTVVAMAGDIPSAAKLSASFICCDIYPFFSAGNPNGPDTMSESAAYVQSAGASAYQRCKQNGKPYWFMGAAFQDPWGPYRISAEGNLVYLPGGNAHFRMPTVAEMRWQNWAALATGARGLIIFSLFYPAESTPKAPAIDPALGFGLTKETDSGAPAALLYADGRPTPQYQAMGDSFARIARIAPILRQLEPSQGMSVFHSRGWIPSGDIVREFRDPQGELYALVVSGEIAKDGVVAVTIPSNTMVVTDLTSGANLPMARHEAHGWEPIGAGFKQLLVALPPGDGTLLRITVAKPGPVSVPTVGAKAYPDMPVTTSAQGTVVRHYTADFQRDKGAADALESAPFRNSEHPHTTGLAGGETIYWFGMPAAITTVAVKARFGNHSDANDHAYRISYSLDGTKYTPLVESTTKGSGDSFDALGEVAIPTDTQQMYISITQADARIVLKNMTVSLGQRSPAPRDAATPEKP